MKAHWGILALALAATPLVAGRSAAEPGTAAQAQKVTLAIPNTQCGRCVASLTGSLKKVPGVQNVTGFTPESKLVVVDMTTDQASVQKLAQAVADTPGLHGKPYEALLLLRVEDLGNADTRKKIDDALKGVKGVDAAMVVDEKTGIIGVKFTKLEAAGEPGANLDPILQALQGAGVKASAYTPSAPAAKS